MDGWNNLPSDVVNSLDINELKKKLLSTLGRLKIYLLELYKTLYMAFFTHSIIVVIYYL